MVRRTIRVVAAAAMIVAGAGACTPPGGGGGSTTTTTIDEHAIPACRTERAAVTTAYAAAHVSRLAGGGGPVETVFDYLQEPPSWFELEPGPTTGPVQRIAGTLGAAPESACGPIPLTDVPLGSF
jgi:hypothetical protein